jgi:hypothetical protein
MAIYTIKAGNTSPNGINFNPFIGSVIEGTARFSRSCLFDTSQMTPREASSYHKLIGICNLFKPSTQSGRLAYRMDMRGNQVLELATYTHNNGAYNVADPGKFICFMEVETDFYFRVETQDRNFKFTINDTTVNHPVNFNKISMRGLQYPYFQAGDKPAPHDMVYVINRK